MVNCPSVLGRLAVLPVLGTLPSVVYKSVVPSGMSTLIFNVPLNN